uniref:hypothetical protein n=1 Tax=Jeotgalibaca porci TaxID=1868793 RepID=UPI00359F311E
KYWISVNEINMLFHLPFMGAGIYLEEGENREQVLFIAVTGAAFIGFTLAPPDFPIFMPPN